MRGTQHDGHYCHSWRTIVGLCAATAGVSVNVSTGLLSGSPRFQLGGTIIPRRETVRRSALLAVWDPITLHVALDTANAAHGQLWLDDGVTTAEARGGTPAALLGFEFGCDHSAGSTSCELRASYVSKGRCARGVGNPAVPPAPLPPSVVVERILVRGLPSLAATTAGDAPPPESPMWSVHLEADTRRELSVEVTCSSSQHTLSRAHAHGRAHTDTLTRSHGEVESNVLTKCLHP